MARRSRSQILDFGLKTQEIQEIIMIEYEKIETLDFFEWRGWPANPLNLFGLAIQTATGGPSHISIAENGPTGEVTQFEAVRSGFEENAFNVHDRGLVAVRRLDFAKLFEPWAVERAKMVMLRRMYGMRHERKGYGWGNIAAATAKILFRYKTPNRSPILDEKDSTICSEAGAHVAWLEDLPGVKVGYKNAITGDDMPPAWVWPVHYKKSRNLITIWEKGK